MRQVQIRHMNPTLYLATQQAISCTGNPSYKDLVDRVRAAASAAAAHLGVSVRELAAQPGCVASGARYPFVQTALALHEARVPRAKLGTLASDALGVHPGPIAACGIHWKKTFCSMRQQGPAVVLSRACHGEF